MKGVTIAGEVFRLQHGVVIFDAAGNPVSTFGGGDASAANQATEIARLDSILSKIITAPATEAKQDSLIAANHTDLAALLAILGAISGAAVVTDANGTAQQYLRGIVKQLIKGQGTMANSLSVALASDQGSLGVVPGLAYVTAATKLQDAATAAGNGVALNVAGMSSVSLQMSGTFSATIQFEASVDGTNYVAVTGTQMGDANLALAFQTTSNTAVFNIPIAGFALFRAKITSRSSGSVTVTAIGIADGSTTRVLTYGGNGGTLSDGLAISNIWQPFGTANGSVSTHVAVTPSLFNGATLDKFRTPSVFKSVTATASGNTAAWTPTSGKKFRLMRFMIVATADSASATSGLTISFQDNTTDIGLSVPVTVPTVAPTIAAISNTSLTPGWIDLGNGKLSAAINNVLNINLSAALTSGKIGVLMAGTEE